MRKLESCESRFLWKYGSYSRNAWKTFAYHRLGTAVMRLPQGYLTCSLISALVWHIQVALVIQTDLGTRPAVEKFCLVKGQDGASTAASRSRVWIGGSGGRGGRRWGALQTCQALVTGRLAFAECWETLGRGAPSGVAGFLREENWLFFANAKIEVLFINLALLAVNSVLARLRANWQMRRPNIIQNWFWSTDFGTDLHKIVFQHPKSKSTANLSDNSPNDSTVCCKICYFLLNWL